MRGSLLRLHQALILAEQVTYERITGQMASPSDLLQLVMNDAWFAWLHPLTFLIDQLDELLDDESALSRAELMHWLNRMRSSICISKAGDGFARSYYEALTRESAVVCAHMELIHLLNSGDAEEWSPSLDIRRFRGV